MASDKAKAEIAEAARQAQGFDGITATAKLDAQAGGLVAELERVRLRLANLSQQTATPQVDIQIGKALATIDRLEAKLALLDQKRVSVDVDVDQDRIRTSGGLLDRLGIAVRNLVTAGGASGGGLSLLTTNLGSLGGIPLNPLVISLGLLAGVLAGALASAQRPRATRRT